MRRTKEEAEITRQNLLIAALEIFSRKGYAATRVEDIASRASVTTGAIYHHFGGKSDLYSALIQSSSARANQRAQQIIEEGGTAATILRRLLIQLFQYAEEDDEYRAAIELSVNKTEVLPELAAINEQIIASRRQLIQFFSSLIAQGVESGDFRSNVSPEDTALALVGFLNGIGLIWIQDQGYFSIGERAESLVDLFLSSIVVD